MNKKQMITLLTGLILIVLIVLFTPRYKIIWIDANNYIQTEQSSELYKRSKGDEKLHWPQILLYSGLTALATAIAIAFLKTKKEKNG